MLYKQSFVALPVKPIIEQLLSKRQKSGRALGQRQAFTNRLGDNKSNFSLRTESENLRSNNIEKYDEVKVEPESSFCQELELFDSIPSKTVDK